MQDTITRCLGLVSQYNPLNTAPGALSRADNVVIRRENIVEDRRGYKVYGSLGAQPTAILPYLSRIIAHNGTKLSFDDGAGVFTDFNGTYTAPTGHKMRGVEAYSNLYVTTDVGVQVATALSAAAGTIRKAGAPRSLDGSSTLTGSSGFLADGKQCAYRFVIQRTDANSNVLFGYPSTRMLVSNGVGGGATRNVAVTLYLPSEVTTSDVIQVYRTEQVTGASTDDNAGDEMALVYQVNPASADISSGFMAFTDSVTDALRGAALYTSPSQEGITQANDRPPLCKDIASFKDFMFYANTSTKQRLFFTLVGTASLSGKTITLAGVTYNFGASEIISGVGSPQAAVSASGIAAVDIDLTARSLVRVINRYAGNTSVYAYYLSGPEDLPGQIMIEERSVGGAAFTVQASDSAISGMFFPAPPVSPATNSKSTSSNSVQKNGLAFSKAQQPEAVPTLNYLFVGPANKNILRIAPLRDSLIIITEAGVYRLSGESVQSFVVTPLDLTVFCKALDSVAVLANQVFMLSNQGVVSISESGVQVVSREITPELTRLLAFSNLSDNTFGTGYESEASYFLSTVTNSTDTAANQIFVYNVFTRAWTRWSFGFSSALVEPSADKFYFVKEDFQGVYRERKDFTDNDYADPELSVTITSISGRTVELTSTTAPQVGWAISQSGTSIAIAAVANTASGYSVVMDADLPAAWAAGAATMFPSVGFDIVWNSWAGGPGNQGMLKQVSEVAILADPLGGNTATGIVPTFSSNFDADQEEVSIEIPGGGWGAAWGAIPWGGSGDSYGYRSAVPRNKQYSMILNPGVKHKKALEKASISGIRLLFNVLGERVSR